MLNITSLTFSSYFANFTYSKYRIAINVEVIIFSQQMQLPTGLIYFLRLANKQVSEKPSEWFIILKRSILKSKADCKDCGF